MASRLPFILFFNPVRHATAFYAELQKVAKCEVVKSQSRNEFFQDLQDKYQNIDVIYRTSASGAVAGNFDAEFISKLPSSCKYICHNGADSVTNPVNSTVPVAAETLRQAGVFDPARLFRVTTLDVVRASTFASHVDSSVNPQEIKVPVIRGHSGATILPLYSQAQPPIQLQEEVLAQVIDRVQFGGDEIVKSKQGAGSATTCMAYAGFRFVKALLAAKSGQEVTEEAYIYLPGVPGGKEIAAELGVDYFSVKVQLSQTGASKALPIGKLSGNEQTLLATAISELKVNIATGLNFMAAKAQS